jgi:hypothetical protein
VKQRGAGPGVEAGSLRIVAEGPSEYVRATLSLNSASFWRVTTTGSIQASLSPAMAPAMSSVRDTAIAPAPAKPAPPGKFVAMLA